ncbi:MAG: hypothetical protein OEW12_01365 [Deltaproteobacteria bacterium]|nr:hypothetical protein [Deltaproteobacteria bacterium]
MVFTAYKPKTQEIKYTGIYNFDEVKGKILEKQVYLTAKGEIWQIITSEFDAQTLIPFNFHNENRLLGIQEEAVLKENQVRYSFKRPSEGELVTGEKEWEPNSFFYANLIPMVVQFWNKTEGGEPVTFNLFLLKRGMFVQMSMVKKTGGDPRSIVLEAQPTSYLFKMLVSPVVITFSEKGMDELKEYQGVSALREMNGSFKDVRMLFSRYVGKKNGPIQLPPFKNKG